MTTLWIEKKNRVIQDMTLYLYDKSKKNKSNKSKNLKNKSMKKILAVCLMLAVMTGLLSGCGNGNPKADSLGGQSSSMGEGDVSGILGGEGNGQDFADNSGNGKTAMGRYVESSVDISEYTAVSFGVTQLFDGSLVILDREAGRLVSEDGGETWREEAIPGIPDLAAFTKENYIFTMKADTDGTIAVLSSPNREEEGEFHTGLIVARPDGSSQKITELKAAEGFVSDIWFAPGGGMFAKVNGGSVLYEVDVETGDMHKYMALQEMPDLLQFQGDYMILLTYRDGITFYNMKEEKWVDDDVLSDFMKQNYLKDYYAYETYTVYMVPGEENVIYVAGKGGVYRHVIGGSAMEQIIDGALSSFSNPSMSMVCMITLENNEFMVLFTGGKLVRYTYDPNVPTVPEELVTVYSLREEDTVRQAIAQYQAQNPQIFVRYEVGMSGSDAVDREDAIKKLNTELMAGKGPDVLILDGLPVDSYIERGVLMDLSGHISGLTGEQALLPNIVESFKTDGKIYRMPVSFMIPAMVGSEDDLAGIHDLASLTDSLERMREENPGKEISGMFSEEVAAKWLLPISAPAFVNETGSLDERVVTDYLEKINRIYTASMEGISDISEEYYANRRELYSRSDVDSYFMSAYNSIGMGLMEFVLGDRVFHAGNLQSVYNFQEAVSLNRLEGHEDIRVQPLDGHCSHVFIPKVMTGITASSTHREEAEAFFDVLMGKEVQQLLWDGYMVNKAALESQLSPQWTVLANAGMNVDYGEVSSSIAGGTGDGRDYTMNIYMPTKEEYRELYDICCRLDTPYVQNTVVEEAVTEFGTQYLKGYLSLEEAVQKIKGKVDIYMAE